MVGHRRCGDIIFIVVISPSLLYNSYIVKTARDRTAKAKLEDTEITESKFADHSGLYAVTR